MASMKHQQAVLHGPFETATVKDIAVYDVDAFFTPQLIVGQKRGIPITQPSIAHQRRLSSKSYKSIIIQKLGSIIY